MRSSPSLLLRCALLTTALSAITLAWAQPTAAPRVRTDFPGGSARVEALDAKSWTLRLAPTLQSDRGEPSWWYFKLEGVRSGEPITLNVGAHAVAKPDHAFFSLDNRTWKPTPAGERRGDRIVYRQRAEASDLWFASSPPFGLSDAQALLAQAAKACPSATVFELCKSREGRSVPALRIAQGERAERYGVWINARQHAWETGSSWVSKGLVEWLVSSDPRAESLRQEAAIYVVPLMDVDNVERGAGGLNQKPRDRRQDWTDEPYWPEVRAAQKVIATLDSYRALDLVLDLHEAGLKDRALAFSVPPRPKLSKRAGRNLDDFLSCALSELTGPLRYEGRSQETGPEDDPNWARFSENWVTQNSHGHVIAAGLEIPGNTPRSTPQCYAQTGRELGLAVERYFRKSPR